MPTMPFTHLQSAFALFLSSLFLSIGCKDKALFEQIIPVREPYWAYHDSLDFSFEITDTSKRYEMDLQVEWADTFKHQNLYLKLGTKFPAGKYVSVIRSYDLFDPQGKANGKCSGSTCAADFIIQERTRFAEPGVYHFTVSQNMRVEQLTGVKSIGLRVTDAPEKK